MPPAQPTRSTPATGDSRPRRHRGGRGGRVGSPSVAEQVAPRPAALPEVPAAPLLPPDTTFAALGVPAPLVEVLESSGISAPFPIQVATLPDTLAGRDVLGRGRTGSGKTLAFSLALVARRRAPEQR